MTSKGEVVSKFIKIEKAVINGLGKELQSLSFNMNQYDKFIIRKSAEGITFWRDLSRYADVDSYISMVRMGRPYQDLLNMLGYTNRGWSAQKKKRLVDVHKNYQTRIEEVVAKISKAKDQKTLTALALEYYDLDDPGVITKEFERSKADGKTMYYVLGLAGIDMNQAHQLGLTQKYPYIKSQYEKSQEPPETKDFPDIEDMDNPHLIYPVAFLGSGTYGSVFVVQIYDYGKAVVKIPSSSPKAITMLNYECMILQMVNCGSPNLLCPRKCSLQPGERPVIFTDYYEGFYDAEVWGKCLRRYLNDQSTTGVLSSIFRQILSAVGYLHQIGMVHRDIKPPNILIKQDFPVIIDFGLAAPKDFVRVSLAGSAEFISPEIYEVMDLLKQNKLTEAKKNDFFEELKRSDIYALGVTFYQMINGRVPFGTYDLDQRKKEGYKYIQSLTSRKPIPVKLPPFRKLVAGLLAPTPKRWTIEQALKEVEDI